MTNPTAAMIVIGDEILSGRTRDSNMHHLANRLTSQGITLTEARVVSDTPAAIKSAVQTLSAQVDYVFTSGGIGPTHDDITAETIASAFDTPISIRDDARAILAAYYADKGQDLNDARLRMARIPDGATLIDNPVSGAPGFQLGNVFVMAGVPRIFEAMLDGVLPGLRSGDQVISETVPCLKGEGDIAGPLTQIAQDFPQLSIGSYPFLKDGKHGTNIVLRGTDTAALQQAKTMVEALQ